MLNTTRNDVMDGLGLADARVVGGLARGMLPADARESFDRALSERFADPAKERLDLLGASTALGGEDIDAYGRFANGEVRIDMILPDRDLLDSLGFEDAEGVEEGIELGAIAATHKRRVL